MEGRREARNAFGDAGCEGRTSSLHPWTLAILIHLVLPCCEPRISYPPNPGWRSIVYLSMSVLLLGRSIQVEGKLYALVGAEWPAELYNAETRSRLTVNLALPLPKGRFRREFSLTLRLLRARMLNCERNHRVRCYRTKQIALGVTFWLTSRRLVLYLFRKAHPSVATEFCQKNTLTTRISLRQLESNYPHLLRKRKSAYSRQ